MSSLIVVLLDVLHSSNKYFHSLMGRPRSSSGYNTRLWIRGSRVRSQPGSMDFFQSLKVLSMISFGREVKPWVPNLLAHSPTFLSLHLRRNSFSNPSIALPMSQLILQPFCCFTYIIVHYPTLLPLLLHHKLFI